MFFILTGEVMGGENIAELVKNVNFLDYNFTCDFCFAKFFLNFKRIYSFPSVPDAFAREVFFIMAGKIIDRETYGGLRPKPPFFLRHNNPE